jgi:hypothetical protein
MWGKRTHGNTHTGKFHYVYPWQRFSTGNTLEDYNPYTHTTVLPSFTSFDYYMASTKYMYA